MTDSYQAVYDATRSRLSNCDVAAAVERAIREMNISHFADMAHRYAYDAIQEWSRPSVLYRPALAVDGDQWFALYGSNIQDGVAGFGESPALAMSDFDANWLAKLQAKGVAQQASAAIQNLVASLDDGAASRPLADADKSPGSASE